jgi:hypothetical protein
MEKNKRYQKKHIAAITSVIKNYGHITHALIADELNSKGILNAQGEPFTTANVQSFIYTHMRRTRKTVNKGETAIGRHDVDMILNIIADKSMTPEKMIKMIRAYVE